ncbi:biliverdin-producing heme oxygenase [Cnuibacter physcomitrellae]|uniref:Biliverdin-producing heme oxygenase n=1 Tax=Cnuibacter physcomitrellae TaxID=1619308 RepID=A0A1X9LRG9_9MICO|nr:biliverdin-producing heme oxygenase [Cnuibacter physcomitrellae]ARJ07032.1 biliverdin-producing heme oxygenase [Cnuibacter physcomitrellae]MCS5497578.1 biliverdin-producing heme oxygenase [Cnuibacter physcomitrellae]GGI39392.1 biliverdin-producing heme oxygenase [Cnuibacter physcomitrellae]
MATVIPFSQALRERTWSGHSDSEGAGFMTDLMSGKGTRDDYVSLVAQHWFIYAALEAAAEAMKDDPVAALFITPKLTRLPALEEDLRFLLGDDWKDRIRPLPTTERYVARIDEVAATWNGGFIAHHYTRYLGDLSGGQIIRTLMQRQFGFETNGVGFYLFDEIAKPKEFKEHYRTQLDAVGWDEAERDRVIDEVLVAYRFNTELFLDLAAAKAAAVA